MFGTHTRQVTEFFRAYSYHYIKSERGSDLGDGGQSHFKHNHGGVVGRVFGLLSPVSSVTLRAPGHVVAGLVERDDPDRVHGARLCGNFCQRLCRPVAGARRMPGLAVAASPLYSVFLTLSGVCVRSSGYPAQRRCCVPRSEDVDCRQSPLASRVLLGRACCLYCSSSLARGPPADGLLCVGVWTASRCSDESWSIVARSP